jgi:hypothetical protein
MEDYQEMASPRLDQPPAPRWRGRKWLLIGGLAFAFMLALGVGALWGSSTGTTQAAALAFSSSSNSQTLSVAQRDAGNSQSFFAAPGVANNAFAAGPGAHGQCEAVTVSSVSGNMIVAKAANGSSVTIHTTASTQYTQAGKAVAASTIKVGTRISVMGTHNSDGSITATSIDIVA